MFVKVQVRYGSSGEQEQNLFFRHLATENGEVDP